MLLPFPFFLKSQYLMFFRMLLLSSLLLVGLPLSAQFPGLSPETEVQQTIGTAIVKLEYQRPIARGREIFGGLVPYDKPWQTSAGSTTISFDEPVIIDGQTLPAGIYALITIPGEKEWTIIIHSGDRSTMRYEESKIRVQTCVPVKKAGRFYESLTIDFDVMQNDARVYISWTDVQISFLLKTESKARAMARVDSLLKGPLLEEDLPYLRAVNYLLFNKLEPAKSVALIKRMQSIKNEEYLYRMLTQAHLQTNQRQRALAAIDEGLRMMRIEFARQPETLSSITEQYEAFRAQALLIPAGE